MLNFEKHFYNKWHFFSYRNVKRMQLSAKITRIQYEFVKTSIILIITFERCFISKYSYFPSSLTRSYTHTHTHIYTHIHIYIYIYCAVWITAPDLPQAFSQAMECHLRLIPRWSLIAALLARRPAWWHPRSDNRWELQLLVAVQIFFFSFVR